MTDNMENLLNNLDAAFKQATVNENGGFELPDDDYVMVVDSAVICKANSSDRIHVKLAVTVVDGDYVGVPHYSYDIRFTDKDGVRDLRAIGFAKLACQKLGLGLPDSMDDFRACIEKFPNRVFVGRIKHNDQYVNLMILRLIHENHTQWIAEGSPADKGSGAVSPRNTGW